jgi:hypothetical protein
VSAEAVQHIYPSHSPLCWLVSLCTNSIAWLVLIKRSSGGCTQKESGRLRRIYALTMERGQDTRWLSISCCPLSFVGWITTGDTSNLFLDFILCHGCGRAFLLSVSCSFRFLLAALTTSPVVDWEQDTIWLGIGCLLSFIERITTSDTGRLSSGFILRRGRNLLWRQSCSFLFVALAIRTTSASTLQNHAKHSSLPFLIATFVLLLVSILLC